MLFLAHVIITGALASMCTGSPKVRTPRAAFLEDVEFLLDNGVNEDDITRRLGYSNRGHLRTRLSRIGRRDILDRLTRARSGDVELRRTA